MAQNPAPKYGSTLQLTGAMALDGGTLPTHGMKVPAATPASVTSVLYSPDGSALYYNGSPLATGSSVSGTTGKLAKFTAPTTLGDSIITESGTTVTVANTLNATTLGGTLSTAAQPAITSVGTLTGGATGSGFTIALTTSTVTGTIPSANVSGSYTSITGVGTLTAGATGAGFTIALSTSNVTGTLSATRGGTNLDTSASTGVAQISAGTWSVTTTLQNAVQDNITRLGTVTTGSFPAANLSGTTLNAGVTGSSLTGVSTVTSGTWSAQFGAVSGANLTNLTAANLTGTIASSVQDNITRLGTVTAGSFPGANLTGTIASGVQDNITRTGTLVSGATGAGFTLALATSTISGTLGVANGGTGIASLSTGRIPYGNGTGALSSSAALTTDGSTVSLTTNNVAHISHTRSATSDLIYDSWTTTATEKWRVGLNTSSSNSFTWSSMDNLGGAAAMTLTVLGALSTAASLATGNITISGNLIDSASTPLTVRSVLDTVTVSAGGDLTLTSATDVVLGLGAATTGTDLVITASNELRPKTSSRRFKTNGRAFTPPPHVLARLKPVMFDYKHGGAKDVAGFYAEDVYKLWPNAVNLDKERKPYSVRNDALIALLVREVQAIKDARTP